MKKVKLFIFCSLLLHQVFAQDTDTNNLVETTNGLNSLEEVTNNLNNEEITNAVPERTQFIEDLTSTDKEIKKDDKIQTLLSEDEQKEVTNSLNNEEITNAVPERTQFIEDLTSTDKEIKKDDKIQTLLSEDEQEVTNNSPLLFKGYISSLFDYHSFDGSLGSGIEGLYRNVEKINYPESYFSTEGNVLANVFLNNSRDSFFGIRVKVNDVSRRYTIGSRLNSSRTAYSVSPKTLEAGIFSKSSSPFTLSLGQINLNYKDVVNLRFGSDLRLDLGPTIMDIKGIGGAIDVNTSVLKLKLLGTRIGSSFDEYRDLGYGSYNTNNSDFTPDYNDKFSRYGVGASTEVSILNKKNGKLSANLSGLHLFNRLSEGVDINEAIKYLYIRIASRATLPSRFPFLLNVNSKISLMTKNGDRREFDLSDSSLYITPYLNVRRPVFDNSTRNNNINYDPAVSTNEYIQPEESRIGLADYFRQSIVLRIPLSDGGTYQIEDIETVNLDFLMRYNFIVSVSLDQVNWAEVVDSKDIYGGFTAIGVTTAPGHPRDPDGRFPGVDYDISVSSDYDVSDFYLSKSRSMGKIGVNLEIGKFKLNSKYTINAYEDYYDSEQRISSVVSLLSGIYLPAASFQFYSGYMDNTYETRFDGLAVKDFNNPNIRYNRFNREYSGIYSAFETVEDNDNSRKDKESFEFKKLNHYYLSHLEDDRTEQIVEGIKYDNQEGSFLTSIYSKKYGMVYDKNNNGIADKLENDISVDYAAKPDKKADIDQRLRPGLFKATFNFSGTIDLPNFSFDLIAYVDYRDQARGMETYSFNRYNTASSNTEKVGELIEVGGNAFSAFLGLGINKDSDENLSKIDFDFGVKYIRDTIANHTWEQRSVGFFDQSQVADFDALLSANVLKLEAVFKSSLPLFKEWGSRVIKFNHSIDQDLLASFDVFLPNEEVANQLDNLPIASTNYWNQNYYNSALDKISKVKKLYQSEGSPLGFDVNYDIGAMLSSTIDKHHKLTLFFNVHNQFSRIPELIEYYVSDFDFNLVYQLNFTKAIYLNSILTLRESLDWNGQEYRSRSGQVEARLQVDVAPVKLFLGFKYLSIDYQDDNIQRFSDRGISLEDLAATKFFINFLINF